MDIAVLGLRVLLALGCVLGLIWFTGRRLQGTSVVRRQRSVPLSVLGRQSLGKGAGVALVEVAGRVLLLGVGEQGVRVLTEVDLPLSAAEVQGAEESGESTAAGARAAGVREELDLSTLPVVPSPAPVADAAEDARVPSPHPDGTARLAALAGLAAGSSSAHQAGALRGSVLSPDTWRRTVDVVQRRTARR